METIIQSQGLQHIVEKSLMCLEKDSFNSFRLVNNDFKGITESPRVLRVLKQENWQSLKDFCSTQSKDGMMMMMNGKDSCLNCSRANPQIK